MVKNMSQEEGLRIRVLSDNYCPVGKMFRGEPAFSLFLEDGGRKILFDTAYSDLFIRNAERMGIDLTEIDAIVLSHGHFDHTHGLVHLMDYLNVRQVHRKIDLICHEEALLPKRCRGESFGNLLSPADLENHFHIIRSREPIQVTPHLLFLGEIERKFDFEAFEPMGEVLKDGGWQPDELIDDIALAYVGRDAVSVISGCAHSGICNITEQARRLSGHSKVRRLLGGFHLQKPSPERLEGSLNYLEELRADYVDPLHCVDILSRCAISQRVPISQFGVGSEIFIPLN